MEDAGRWSLVRRAPPQPQNGAEAVEHVARTLLRRYGVVFWRLIEREAPGCRRGATCCASIAGSKAAARSAAAVSSPGFSGEQFALPDAIGMLRETRRKPETESWVAVSGADPLNLAGILTPGPKIPALAGNRVLYRDGVPAAAMVAGQVTFFIELDPATEWQAENNLLRGPDFAPSLMPDISTAEPVEAR